MTQKRVRTWLLQKNNQKKIQKRLFNNRTDVAQL